MSGLNKDSPVPLYHQLKDLILKGILAGQWQPDAQLPTEDDLALRFNVSKITVRQALRELASLGYLRREQGRGTFVERPHFEQGPRELVSFTEEMRRRGLVASSRVLEQGIVPASAEVAARLRIRARDPLFRLRRLRLAGGDPMGVQTAYLPLALVPGIDQIVFGDASLYDVLRARYSLHPVGGKETYLAALVSRDDARLLESPAGSPAIAAERLTYLAGEQPFELVQSLMRGDRYKVVLDLTTEPATRRS